MATSTTRTTLMQDIVKALGGFTGNISSGTATTAVLAGLLGNTNDDAHNDWLLLMPDAATAADQERIVTDWTGSSGTATFASRSDTTYTSETYMLIPMGTWTATEIRDAINYCLGNTKRTYRYVVPSREHAAQIALADLSWLRNAKDVDGVYWSNCPGLLHNADFSYWHSGTTSAPDGWTVAGAGNSLARSSSWVSFGAYSVALTSAAADAQLYQDVPYQLVKQLIDAGATVTIKARVQASSASVGRVRIDTGDQTTSSDYHSGDGEPEDLSASYTLTAAASRIRFVCEVATGTNTATFDFVAAVEGAGVPDDFFNSGGAGYLLQPGHAQLWNVGSGVPVLASDFERARGGQWIVVSRRPFATLASDTASTEADSDLVVSGALYQLAMKKKRGMDAAYLEEIKREHGPIYTTHASALIDKPPLEPQGQRFYVHGA